MASILPEQDKIPQSKIEAMSEIAYLDDFYHSAAGHRVAYFLRRIIQPALHLEAKIDRLGFGYPFMCLPSAVPPVLIPREMGALAHGGSDGVMSASVASDAWPIATESLNQIIMCHGLEYCFDGEACLSEANRVLVSAGELLLMVPNRASLWVRDDSTPLGHGRPFSKGQIGKWLSKTGFHIIDVRRGLFVPPRLLHLPMKLADFTDRCGHYGWGLFGGMIIIRASKLRYATKARDKAVLIPSLSPGKVPAIKPAMSSSYVTGCDDG